MNIITNPILIILVICILIFWLLYVWLSPKVVTVEKENFNIIGDLSNDLSHDLSNDLSKYPLTPETLDMLKIKYSKYPTKMGAYLIRKAENALNVKVVDTDTGKPISEVLDQRLSSEAARARIEEMMRPVNVSRKSNYA